MRAFSFACVLLALATANHRSPVLCLCAPQGEERDKLWEELKKFTPWVTEEAAPAAEGDAAPAAEDVTDAPTTTGLAEALPKD